MWRWRNQPMNGFGGAMKAAEGRPSCQQSTVVTNATQPGGKKHLFNQLNKFNCMGETKKKTFLICNKMTQAVGG